VFVERVAEQPTADGLRTAATLAEADDALVPALVAALARIPPRSIPRPTPPTYRRVFKDDARFAEVFAAWEEHGPKSAKASKRTR
jgi:hypothetical protein